jgi:hemoglobin
MYDRIGRTPGCKRLAEALYAGIARDPVLRPFFPGKTLKCAIAEFTAFLVQFLGGPAEESQWRRWLHLGESHRRFPIGARERNAWLKHMSAAIESLPVDDAVRSELHGFFAHASARLVNQGAPPAAPVLEGGELAGRWSTQLEVHRAIEAIRRRDAEQAIAMLNTIAVSDSVRCGLLAQMLHARVSAMTRYVHATVRRSPDLVRIRYYSRTLLHTASALGMPEAVKVLLELGADPNGGGHQPLYSLANEYGGAGGGPIVHMLVAAGADVDACDNVKRCTALHMAARRDHVEIAGALLDCGADIDARDTTGTTPLGRAVNLNRMEVAALLVRRGADIHLLEVSPKGARRSAAMRRLLHSDVP